MASPFVATNRLANVFEMISLAGKTGILRATRGTDSYREYGQVVFVGGQLQSVMMGSLSGELAMLALSNWSDCFYSFDETPETSGVWQSRRSTSTSMRLEAEGMPRYAQSWPLVPQADFTFASAASPSTAMTDPPANSFASSSPWQANSGVTVPSNILAIVPARTNLGSQLDNLPLDRRERMLLMLVDGNRTVSDLARLTRMPDQEAYATLLHLAQVGYLAMDGRPIF